MMSTDKELNEITLCLCVWYIPSLFSPSMSDHIAQITVLLGKIPPSIALSGKYSVEYFSRTGICKSLPSLLPSVLVISWIKARPSVSRWSTSRSCTQALESLRPSSGEVPLPAGGGVRILRLPSSHVGLSSRQKSDRCAEPASPLAELMMAL